MPDGVALARIVHRMPGRTRLRVEGRRGEEDFFLRLAAALHGHQPVTAVSVRPLTGSILLHHVGPVESLAPLLMERGLRLETATAPSPRAEPGSMSWRAFGIASLGGAAIVQLLRGELLPPAFTLAWYALAMSGGGHHDHAPTEPGIHTDAD